MKIKQKIDNLAHLITVRNYKFSENLHDETVLNFEQLLLVFVNI